jgi:alpha-glucosidase
VGILPLFPDFNTKLQKAFDQAVKQGKWENTYAKTNVWEYFAEGVQDWFNCNGEMAVTDGKHNQVNTRKELKEYDLNLYNIIKEFFPETKKIVSCHSTPFE